MSFGRSSASPHTSVGSILYKFDLWAYVGLSCSLPAESTNDVREVSSIRRNSLSEGTIVAIVAFEPPNRDRVGSARPLSVPCELRAN